MTKRELTLKEKQALQRVKNAYTTYLAKFNGYQFARGNLSGAVKNGRTCGLTLQEIGDAIGMTMSAVQKWEKATVKEHRQAEEAQA